MGVAQTCAALHSRVFSRLITRHYNNKLASTGLRITQFSVMNAIKVFPPESIHQLAELIRERILGKKSSRLVLVFESFD